MSDVEVKSIIRKIENETNFVALAEMLQGYFQHPETLPTEGKIVLANTIIAKTFDLGADNMALRVGRGLASLAK